MSRLTRVLMFETFVNDYFEPAAGVDFPDLFNISGIFGTKTSVFARKNAVFEPVQAPQDRARITSNQQSHYASTRGAFFDFWHFPPQVRTMVSATKKLS